METPTAPKEVTITYLEPRRFRQVVELVSTFDTLHSSLMAVPKGKNGEPAIGVYLRDKDANVLGVGLADEGWLVIFGDGKHTHMAFSVGDPAAKGDVTFRFQQQEQLPRRYLLSVDNAIQAIRCWFETGKLSDAVKWDVQAY